MKLGYGTIGSVIKFKNKNSRWDGQSEYYRLLKALSRRSNINQIYFLSKTDWNDISEEERRELDPYGKVIDTVSLIPLAAIRKATIRKVYDNDDHRLDSESKFSYYLSDYFRDNKIVLDHALLFASQGLASPMAIAGQLRIKRGEQTRGKILAMTVNYSSPILAYLNTSKVTWDLIGTDPRYVSKKMYPRGIENPPQHIFAQKSFTACWETLDHYKDYNDYSESIKEFSVRYGGVEKINLIGEPIVNKEKKHDLMVVANNLCGNETKPKSNKRFQEIKKYLLDENINCDIYGKWPEEITSQYKQFKGFLPGNEIDERMCESKYTILFPLGDGWLSSKFGEMLRIGVIPFIHPDYDTDKNAAPGNKFIRISDPSDLNRKIEYLNKNPKEREELLEKLRSAYIVEVEEQLFSSWNKIKGQELY